MAKASQNSRTGREQAQPGDKAGTAVDARRAEALELLLDAWEAALEDGIEPEILASSAIFVALTDMIENHGEEFVAQMAEGLPARIRAGEFTLIDQPENRI